MSSSPTVSPAAAAIACHPRRGCTRWSARTATSTLQSGPSGATQTGFTDLWLFGDAIGQDLISKYSIEALMLEERFRPLFTNDERAEAQRRIDEINEAPGQRRPSALGAGVK